MSLSCFWKPVKAGEAILNRADAVAIRTIVNTDNLAMNW